ncbi:Uncharacterized protein Cob_v007294 [Colletotrichum orbiculare MAFF 240422]|uniref:Uncharacterized protein n=1 Tax=Colletotrichum orbiculare (strain 104-T / ATCC 96160 / CBS 514.97 / LARS 414 / MAFF 240422) TaxID=1213857 RepID=A0A484FPN8_COLOR|nr:Uncharacterized protein Cob_v007294 [Colletotrichum orbiculare MAFF 240422]
MLARRQVHFASTRGQSKAVRSSDLMEPLQPSICLWKVWQDWDVLAMAGEHVAAMLTLQRYNVNTIDRLALVNLRKGKENPQAKILLPSDSSVTAGQLSWPTRDGTLANLTPCNRPTLSTFHHHSQIPPLNINTTTTTTPGFSLSRLLPLPEDELKQMLDYASTLSKNEAATHFADLLGDSPQAVEFISSFNSRRKDTQKSAQSAPVPNDDNAPEGVPRTSRGQKKKKQTNLHTPAPRKVEAFPSLPGASYSKKGQEDDYYVAKKQPSQATERGSSAFVTSKPQQPPKIESCLTIFYPETFHETDNDKDMIKELKAERGRERMAADREAHRRPEVSKKPLPFSQNKISEAEAKAREHRDKLLNFQAQNARRTTVRDEAADFDVSGAMAGTGGSMWSSPEERARELKRQQKVLREIEWNARPDYEKRRQVVSIDVVGGKVVRKMAAVERPTTPDEDVEVYEDVDENGAPGEQPQATGGGAFSHNPLLGALIKPVWDAKGKGAQLQGRKDRKTQWRRVQDDFQDNEAVILDGGAHGHSVTADEPACG